MHPPYKIKWVPWMTLKLSTSLQCHETKFLFPSMPSFALLPMIDKTHIASPLIHCCCHLRPETDRPRHWGPFSPLPTPLLCIVHHVGASSLYHTIVIATVDLVSEASANTLVIQSRCTQAVSSEPILSIPIHSPPVSHVTKVFILAPKPLLVVVNLVGKRRGITVESRPRLQVWPCGGKAHYHTPKISIFWCEHKTLNVMNVLMDCIKFMLIFSW